MEPESPSTQSSPTPPTPYVHLHVHSEYSLLDGSIKIKKLIKELKKQGAKAAALTDHDSLHGVLEFYLGCQAEGIQPILGYEANLPFWNPETTQLAPGMHGHLVLLAQNQEGYQNLLKISSYANTTGKLAQQKEVFELPWSVLMQHSSGLICLTACQKSEFNLLLASGRLSSALDFLEHLKGIFSRENVYVELIDNHLPGQRELITLGAQLATQAGLECVATADVHYLHPKDVQTHLSLLAIKHKLQRHELQKVESHYWFHLATEAEMQERFALYPKALENTWKIAQRCQVKIDTKSVFMPDFRERPDESADDCLLRLSREGLELKKPTILLHVPKETSPEAAWKSYQERLEYELGVIIKMKFSGYFLIVQDFINWARKQDIPVGPGRGSAAGSLVTYALGITNIDPIRFNLLFERFLNPDRISMPDIDTDFCQDRRGEVIQYVYQKYGQDNVSQIVTFGRMMARNAIKNLARIQGWSFFESNEFAKLIPETPGITLEQALKEEEKLEEKLKADERSRALWHEAVEIEGTLNSLGVHAAGVIISDAPLDTRCPMMESEGQRVTQLEHKYAEKIGLIKFDFLGLKTLTVIETCVQHVRKRSHPTFEIESIDLEDPKVYSQISTAHVTGIFQLESAGMRKLIAELQPTCFTDIIAILALFRPGPLGSGMVEDFVLRKHGKNPVEYAFPELEEILRDTYGVIVYQEQVQKIAAVLASYSLGEADLLRRAMGKKDKGEMERQKARFVEGATKNGHDPQKAADLFDLMAKFAEYGFNKSHTAAYGWVTYQTAYLKCYFPTEFMAALLTCDMDNTDKVVSYWMDCKRMGMELLGPDINQSDYAFSIPKDHCIRFGLGAVKGLGRGIVLEMIQSREKDGPFHSVPEFMVRVDSRKLNKKIIDVLVMSGCFDSISSNRAELLGNFENWLKCINKEMERKDGFKKGIFDYDEEDELPLKSSEPIRLPGLEKSPQGKPPKIANAHLALNPLLVPTTLDSPLGWVKKHLKGISLKKCTPWGLLATLEKEKECLGFYCSTHPSKLFENDLKQFSVCPIHQLPDLVEADDVPSFKRKAQKIVGVVVDIFEKKTKAGEKFCVLKIQDSTGELEVTVFPKQFSALDFMFSLGELGWFEVQLKKGIESKTVRSVCVAMGKLEEKRAMHIKSWDLTFDESLIRDEATMQKLQSTLRSFAGKTPVLANIDFPSEKLKLKGMLGISVSSEDQFLKKMSEIHPGKLFIEPVYLAEWKMQNSP